MSRYRLVGRLETGELAELYRAVRDDGVPVVIKLFHEKTSDAAYARELAQTARVLNPLAHEGIIHFLEVGLIRRRLAVVREYVDGYLIGQALQRLVTKEVLLPPAVALHVIVELLEAVERGHEAGCIHGAITPGNIMLSKDGRTAVADFGALRALQASPALKSFLQKGRGSYRAPEVARGEVVTQESDIYSLGAIAYELLTLRELSPGQGMSVRREAIPPPSRVDRRINSRLDPVIMRAVELMPGRRYRHCGEMVTAIRNYLSASGGMPSKDDVRRFVADLFPTEVKLESLGPVPFQEEFALTEVSGATLPELEAERSPQLQDRPAFSGETPAFVREEEPPVDSRAETVQSAPAFPVYKPKPAAQPAPVGQDEGTNPGGAGPLEQGWHAPSAAAPPKGPRLRPQGVGAQDGATAAALKGRVRVVEDFAPLPSMSQEIKDEAARAAINAATLPSPAPAVKPQRKATLEPKAAVEVTDPSGSGATSGPSRGLSAEQKLSVRAQQRSKLLMIAASIAVIGAASFGYAVWRYNGQSPPQSRLRLSDPGELGVREPEPPKQAQPTAKEEPAEPLGERGESPVRSSAQTARRADVGYLTISSNVAAWVWVDGSKLKQRTPIRRHAVAPGSRTIVLEAVGTGERKRFTLAFARGQERTVIEHFEKRRSRR